MRRLRDYSLITNNTFGIDAKAKEFIEYDSVAELEAVIPELRDRTVLHIGGGSNLLFTGDFDGVVLHSNIQEIEVTHNGRSHVDLRVGGGFVWDELVAFAVANGWSGVENLSLIPGEVGAAAVQNIGAYGCEAKDVIVSVETVDLTDGSHRTFKNEECGYGHAYFVGLLSERLVFKENSKNPWQWEKIPGHERNEPLDCRNYAYAAFTALSPDMDALHRRANGNKKSSVGTPQTPVATPKKAVPARSIEQRMSDMFDW